MRSKKRLFILGVLLIITVLIHWFCSNKTVVELHYSSTLYPYISFALTSAFGWLSFSIGDILYGFLVAWLLFNGCRFISQVFQKKISRQQVLGLFIKILSNALLIYILFNVLWGINYNREGIASNLGLKVEKYSTTELLLVDSLLLQKVNNRKAVLLHQSNAFDKKNLFNEAAAAYAVLGKQYPFLAYYPESIKPSMWGWLGNYVGFLGYYNPFTGEAQVNTTVPEFLLPFTSCHEIAHQLGYAKENEANFVGYLAAAASADTFFHYSVYLDLFLYTNRNLYGRDSGSAKHFASQLLPAVKADLMAWKEFDRQHQNPLEPLVRWAYGKYLQGNQQPSGMKSYDEVTGLLIAYYKKMGVL